MLLGNRQGFIVLHRNTVLGDNPLSVVGEMRSYKHGSRFHNGGLFPQSAIYGRNMTGTLTHRTQLVVE